MLKIARSISILIIALAFCSCRTTSSLENSFKFDPGIPIVPGCTENPFKKISSSKPTSFLIGGYFDYNTVPIEKLVRITEPNLVQELFTISTSRSLEDSSAILWSYLFLVFVDKDDKVIASFMYYPATKEESIVALQPRSASREGKLFKFSEEIIPKPNKIRVKNLNEVLKKYVNVYDP